MQRNRLTRWFLIGFVAYAAAAIGFSLVTASGGALALALLSLVGAGSCGLKLWLDKTGF